MKQTAIKWLINQLQRSKDFHRVLNEISQMSSVKIDILQQAKEMEKQQIIEAWYNGFEENRPYVDHSEDYYNKCYKQQDNEK